MKMLTTWRHWSLAAAVSLTALGAHAQVKIAYIDPLSGGGASVGEDGLKHIQYLAEEINAKGGVILGQKLEIVASTTRAARRKA